MTPALQPELTVLTTACGHNVKSTYIPINQKGNTNLVLFCSTTQISGSNSRSFIAFAKPSFNVTPGLTGTLIEKKIDRCHDISMRQICQFFGVL